MRKPKETSNRDVFVDTLPVDSDPVTDQFPLLTFSFGSMVEARKPLKGSADLTPV
jgi:hypothetical protein